VVVGIGGGVQDAGNEEADTRLLAVSQDSGRTGRKRGELGKGEERAASEDGS
jgi:hypothetical protein